MAVHLLGEAIDVFRHVALLIVLLLSGVADSSAQDSKARPSLCAVGHPSDAKVKWSCRRLRHDETLERHFGDRWVDVARFNRVDRRHAGASVALKVPARLEDIRDFTPMPREYPEAEAGAKLIVVDLAEQFLGTYERGRLVLSAPVATGEARQATLTGHFRITAADRSRRSSLYSVEGTNIPYPMNWALRFHISAQGIAFWIHGRDIPGYPASHGCIGLYDERMQREYYGQPRDPVLDDARALYEWVVGPGGDAGGFRTLNDGPRVRIIGRAPRVRT